MRRSSVCHRSGPPPARSPLRAGSRRRRRRLQHLPLPCPPCAFRVSPSGKRVGQPLPYRIVCKLIGYLSELRQELVADSLHVLLRALGVIGDRVVDFVLEFLSRQFLLQS